MTGLYAGHNRRRRRKLYLVLAAIATLTILLRGYVQATFNILIRGPFIAGHYSEHMRITPERDGFDITFKSYPSDPIQHPNASLPVPPLMHHIYLGKPKPGKADSTARNACMNLHPGYEFKFWTDSEADNFVLKEFPDLYQMWKSYPHVIQKADSLRYMILYRYGGKFRALDPVHLLTKQVSFLIST
jgi:Glycosyltransferase sugar-binding region containing DXD motif